jgi:hypothetical protein
MARKVVPLNRLDGGKGRPHLLGMANPSSSSPSGSSGKNARGKTGAGTTAAPKPPVDGRPNGNTVTARPSADQIAQRAYEIYERDGRQPGRELENWLRAEAELANETH